MILATRLWSSRWFRSLSGLALLALAACALALGWSPTAGAGTPAAIHPVLTAAALGAEVAPDKLDPAAVAGSKACVECHKSEMAALTKSKHHESLKLIEGSGGNIAKYAKAVGLGAGDVLNDSLCVRCHATPQGSGNSVHAISSVSCESCHGGAAGKTEWLKLHATKGITDAQRAQCDEAGMIRASNIYGIAKNCTGCHVISNAELVNAGHPVSTKWDFELVGGSTGEVRHNFQVNQKVNAEGPSLWLKNNPGATVQNRRRLKYVVGLLTDLEATLNNLKDVGANDGKTPFAKGHSKRVKNLAKALDKVAETLGAAAPAELKEAAEATQPLTKASALNFKNQDEAKAAYPIVAKAAATLAAQSDGGDMKALDGLIKSEVKPRGKPPAP